MHNFQMNALNNFIIVLGYFCTYGVVISIIISVPVLFKLKKMNNTKGIKFQKGDLFIGLILMCVYIIIAFWIMVLINLYYGLIGLGYIFFLLLLSFYLFKYKNLNEVNRSFRGISVVRYTKEIYNLIFSPINSIIFWIVTLLGSITSTVLYVIEK